MPMQLQIITAEREVFSGEVDALVAPGMEGQLGILPRHAPLITVLQPGELMVRSGGEESFLALSGGYMEVLGNQVIILADAAEDVDEIDETRAQAAMEQAQQRIANRRVGRGTGASGGVAAPGAGEGDRGAASPQRASPLDGKPPARYGRLIGSLVAVDCMSLIGQIVRHRL